MMTIPRMYSLFLNTRVIWTRLYLNLMEKLLQTLNNLISNNKFNNQYQLNLFNHSQFIMFQLCRIQIFRNTTKTTSSTKFQIKAFSIHPKIHMRKLRFHNTMVKIKANTFNNQIMVNNHNHITKGGITLNLLNSKFNNNQVTRTNRLTINSLMYNQIVLSVQCLCKAIPRK